MARVPKSVSATSGQGVSRKSYQMGRNLGMSGTGASAGLGANAPKPLPIAHSSPATGGGGVASGKRTYAKSGQTGSMQNIEYSEREMATPNLGVLKGLGKAKPPKAGKGFV